LCGQRESGREKYDIALQKLDEEDAADELLMRIETDELAHFKYSQVATVQRPIRGLRRRGQRSGGQLIPHKI